MLTIKGSTTLTSAFIQSCSAVKAYFHPSSFPSSTGVFISDVGLSSVTVHVTCGFSTLFISVQLPLQATRLAISLPPGKARYIVPWPEKDSLYILVLKNLDEENKLFFFYTIILEVAFKWLQPTISMHYGKNMQSKWSIHCSSEAGAYFCIECKKPQDDW